jgi:hypothetical protein
MDVEAQIAGLTRRVAALETEAQGRQRYNAPILGMLTELRDGVAIPRSHAVGLGQRFDALEAKVTAEIGGLRRDLPAIIAETMREVLREGK